MRSGPRNRAGDAARCAARGWTCRGLVVLVAAWFACMAAAAGTLTRAQIEPMFPPPMMVGEKLAHIPAWPIFRRNSTTPELQYFVFETVDLEPVAGYGGKPLNLLVVMDRDGAFVQTTLLDHSEPIFRSASGNATLSAFAAQYQGLTVNHQVQILGAKAQREVTPTVATLHGIVAGTVTARAIDRTQMESAAQVAQAAANPLAAQQATAAARGADDRFQRTGWNGLVGARLLQQVPITNRELEAAFRGTAGAGRDAEGLILPGATGVDLWLAFAGISQAGRNLLLPPRWREVRELREEQGTPVLLVLDGGRYALRAPGAAGSGPDLRGIELNLRQGELRHRLRALPWHEGLKLSGQSSGLAAGSAARWFAVEPAADGAAIDVLAPLTLDLSAWRRSGSAPGDVARARFERRFEIPDAAAYRAQRETPRWLEPWAGRSTDLALLGAGLLVLALALAAQRVLAATPRRLARFRIAYLVFTLVFIGWFAQGQLTIVSLTALIEALVAGRSTEFLLLDPMAVLLWVFTGITLVVWGRGTFCGWLCPFGALQELVARVAKGLGFAQKRLRAATDARLKAVKYVVLAALCGAAATSAAWTERMVEVEPFKTSISTYFQRDWPYVAWALACIALGVFVYRGYCRYICPLGAALALLGRVRIFNWIARRSECGTPCQTCRHRCDYQAIAPAGKDAGKIDYAECFQCLDCVQLYDDQDKCLPLVRERKGRTIPIRLVTETLGTAA